MKNKVFGSQLISVRLLTVLALTATSLVACGKLDDMQNKTNEMGDTTKDMSKTTKDMSNTTKGMARTTESMESQTEELYDLSRQGGTRDVRQKALANLLAARSPGKKIAEAAVYFSAFEYQFFMGAGVDGAKEKRDVLLYDAACEFVKELKEFALEEIDVDPKALVGKGDDALSDNNKQLSFNAIAAAIHKVNRKQEENHKASGLSVVSMETMIRDSLLSLKAIRAGKMALSSLPAYQRELISNETLITRLMRARLNFLPMILFAEARPFSDLSRGPEVNEAGKAAADGKLMMVVAMGGQWTVDAKRVNAVQLQNWTQYMGGFQRTFAIMKEAELPLGVNFVPARLISGMQLEGKVSGETDLSSPTTNATKKAGLKTKATPSDSVKAKEELKKARQVFDGTLSSTKAIMKEVIVIPPGMPGGPAAEKPEAPPAPAPAPAN